MRFSTSGGRNECILAISSSQTPTVVRFLCRPHRVLLNQLFSWFWRPSTRWIQIDILQIKANFKVTIYDYCHISEVFQTIIIFYVLYLPGSTCFDFVNRDLSNCTHQFRLTLRLAPSLQKHAVRLVPIMSVFTTEQNSSKECHLTFQVKY